MKQTVFVLITIWIFSTATHARQSCDWPFQTQINITEQSGSDLSDYQVKLNVSGGNLHSDYAWTIDGFDFRIFDSDDTTSLDFWIEDWDQANETASIWVRFPTSAPLLANQTRTIYLYYGNENASALANVPFTFVEPGIKFHARNTSYNPSNKTQAFDEFDSLTDSNNNSDGYGCTFITNFTGVTKNATFGNGDNFAAYSESYFEVAPAEEGLWEFRYGADFGRGGALYIDDIALEEDWNNDLWWASNWNNADVLQGSITLNAGYHKLEVIGFEGCCDGGITVQFKRPGGNWTTFTTNDIDIRSRACPVDEPSVSFGAHDTCELVDLRVRNSGLSIPSNWEVNIESDISFGIRNTNNGDSTTSAPITTTLSLPAGFTLNSYTGTNWSCSPVGSDIECSYALALGTNSNSTTVTLSITPSNSASLGSDTISIDVSSVFYDVRKNNNSVNQAINVEDNNAIAAVTPTCTVPDNGIWARFFDITGYPDNSIDNESEMQTLVDSRANENFVDGQTIIDNINGNQNPFDDRGDDQYLLVLNGYLDIPTSGDYDFGVDGDDAVEFRLNNSVVSHFYQLHGTNGSPVDVQTIRLAAGFHEIEFRLQEFTGQAAFDLYWNPPNGGTEIVPNLYFYHCAGHTNIQLNLSINVISDPVNNTTLPKAIPGAVVQHTIEGFNQGNISTDYDSTVITQALDVDSELFVNDLSGNGPIDFIDYASPNESGLFYTYTSLSDINDSISFSNDSGATFNYTPVPDADGYDSAVTHFRLNLDGSLKPQVSTVQPGFNIIYQTQLK